MTTRNRIVFACLLIACAQICAAADLSKPSVFTNPPSYLREFPLGTVHTADLLGALGVPDKSITVGPTTFISYVLGEGYGRREFVFIITDDVVTDVQYNSQGAYNGDTAKKEQGAS